MPEDLPRLSPVSSVADSAAGALPLNRVVVLATPLLASSAALLGGWLVESCSPGSGRMNDATRCAVMLAASASATAMAYKWLEGWQRYEKQEFEVENGMITTESVAVREASYPTPEELALEGDDDYSAADPELEP